MPETRDHAAPAGERATQRDRHVDRRSGVRFCRMPSVTGNVTAYLGVGRPDHADVQVSRIYYDERANPSSHTGNTRRTHELTSSIELRQPSEATYGSVFMMSSAQESISSYVGSMSRCMATADGISNSTHAR
jgi:hypothetical protein